ncbi:hypothetical protein VSDG_08650 [Cytospora chrysosperma]|uniref:Uncharacterized protein n=1 Tax=Cytospora chrysosperma TaxID=252740 RepID=A0A423VEH3_CYTCH|nr:hypothetical protein VSDG_08650 [Valsa sordida]
MEEASSKPRHAPSAAASKPLHVRQPSSRQSRPQPNRLTSNRTSRDPSVKTTTLGNGIPQRPTGGFNRLNTRYMEMLLSLDNIPRIHNILASFFGWLVLAGFVVFPGTFTSIEDLSDHPGLDPEAGHILDHVQNIPLLIVAAVCCGIGAIGLLYLVFRWRRNYVWLLNRIFLPGATNALAGFISTLVTVYSQKEGNWSVMATVTGVVEVVDLLVCGVLFVLSTLLLKRIKWKHGKELNKLEHADEGFLEKAERKIQEPAMEPQSVV